MTSCLWVMCRRKSTVWANVENSGFSCSLSSYSLGGPKFYCAKTKILTGWLPSGGQRDTWLWPLQASGCYLPSVTRGLLYSVVSSATLHPQPNPPSDSEFFPVSSPPLLDSVLPPESNGIAAHCNASSKSVPISSSALTLLCYTHGLWGLGCGQLWGKVYVYFPLCLEPFCT